MSKKFAVVLVEGADTQLVPTLSAHLHKGDTGWYFLADQIDPNGVYLHMTLAREGDASGKHGIELHIPHPMVRYILTAHSVKQLGF